MGEGSSLANFLPNRIRERKFKIIWKMNRNLLTADIELMRDVQVRGILTNRMRYIISSIYRGFQETYFSERDWSYLSEDCALWMLQRNNAAVLSSAYKTAIRAYWRFCEKFRHINVDTLTDKKFRAVFDQHQILLTRIFGYFKSTRPEVYLLIGKKALSIMKNIDPNNYHADFLNWITDARYNIMQKENIDFVKLFARKRTTKQLLKHIYTHPWEQYMIYSD